MSKKMGEILLENGVITAAQLEEALAIKDESPRQTIGQILCALGYVDKGKLEYFLDLQGKRRKLVEIILQEKLVTMEQYAQARDLSNRDRIPLERSLVALGLLTDEQMTKVVAIQNDLPFVHLNTSKIDHELAQFMNPAFAQKHGIVPISQIGNTLTLAMSSPIKGSQLSELEATIRRRIIPVIAHKDDIRKAQQLLYSRRKQGPAEERDEHLTESVLDIGDLLTQTAGSDEPEIDEEVKKVTEKDSIIVKLVNKIIYDAYHRKASDIHIEPYPGKNDIVVRMRVDGKCSVYQRIPYKYKYAIPSRIKIMADLDIAERRRPQDGKIPFKKFGPVDLELRVSVMPTAGQMEDVVIRLLNTGEQYSLDQLGLTDRNRQQLETALSRPYGLVLVVGPTGSGKTTTLHSALARINNQDLKIWTAEDPVEITQAGLRQVQINPKIGFTFAAALRSFLRLDPDVIMVGEMRDLETAAIGIEASLTGHLVLSTLHTNTAPETVVRLLEMGLDPFSFSDSLVAILSQRLARTFCLSCRETYTPSEAEVEELVHEFGEEQFWQTGKDRSKLVLTRATGCNRCDQTGYRGRIGIHELLVCTPPVKGLIRRRSDTEALLNQAVADGMMTLKQDGILKVLQGLTDLREIRRVCIQ
jgi:type II secretory ATPase GspE/PulE/Tfp pilus assembly ATPase PilB-like protein